MKSKPRLIVRNFSTNDIPLWTRYWYESSPDYLDAMGVDPTKLQPQNEFIQFLENLISEDADLPLSKMRALTVEWDLKPIGVHTLTEIEEGKSGVLHAHYFEKEMRGKGLGAFSYLLACSIYMSRFNLQEVLFKTPKFNTSPNRIKEKLGIPRIGETVLTYPILKPGIQAFVYSLSRSHLEELMVRTDFP